MAKVTTTIHELHISREQKKSAKIENAWNERNRSIRPIRKSVRANVQKNRQIQIKNMTAEREWELGHTQKKKLLHF